VDLENSPLSLRRGKGERREEGERGQKFNQDGLSIKF